MDNIEKYIERYENGFINSIELINLILNETQKHDVPQTPFNNALNECIKINLDLLKRNFDLAFDGKPYEK
jgi:hypothetical protein